MKPLNYSYIYSHNDGLYNNIVKTLDLNFGLYACVLLAGFIVNYKTGDCIVRTGFTYLLITLWTYYVHKSMHIYAKAPIGIIHGIHHNLFYKDSTVAEIFEVFVNIILIGGLFWVPIMMLIENLIGFKIVNHYMIVIWAIIFTSYHLINYHVVSHDIHAQHHIENGMNNYGPDPYDILFNTKAEHSNIEDMNSVIINIFITIFLVLSVKDTPYDIIQLIHKKVIE